MIIIRNSGILLITVSLVIFYISGAGLFADTAVTRSAGDGRGASHGGPAGTGPGSSDTHGFSVGPLPGRHGSMTESGKAFGPPAGIGIQGYRYGAPDPMETGFNAYQESVYGSVPAGAYGPGQVTAANAGSNVMSLQSRGIAPGTCMWDCTAAYTPTECRQWCQ